jgi:4-hydroxy-tetrahydrodipicolinate reductase
MIRVGVFGAGGRMGAEVCRSVYAEPELQLAAAVDPAFSGQDITQVAGITGVKLIISDEAEALLDGEVDVAVDFTQAESAFQNVQWCIRHAVNAVVGTTGLKEDQIQQLREMVDAEGNESNVFIAPNFAIGAVLMMQFARMAAKWFPDVEIIELHHAVKRDAPSGTALRTLEGILAGRMMAENGPTEQQDIMEMLAGARGAEKDGVRIHSIRLPGLVAHHEVIFGGPGQTLTIRHDSMDRASFMPGVILAIKQVSRLPGVTVGLEKLLGI